MVAAAMTRPSRPTLARKGLVRMPSLRGRGFSRITLSVWGSRPRAMAGRESVRRLMNSRWTAAKGTGRASSEAYSTVRMPAKLPESRNWMERRMLA